VSTPTPPYPCGPAQLLPLLERLAARVDQLLTLAADDPATPARQAAAMGSPACGKNPPP
jgi:hypothetical protein